MLMLLFRFLLTLFALALIFFGFILMLSPIPFGIILIALGFLLLAAVAPSVLRWLRKRWRWLDRRLDALQERLPEWIAKHLRKSDYEHDDDGN